MTTQFDFLVIGAGSGGIAAANRAAMHGQRVGIIEADTLGGTCVNRGCVPKKVMWYAAKIAQAAQFGPDYGFQGLSQTPHDWATLVKNRDAYIDRIHQSYQRGFDTNKVTLIEGHARFVDHKTLSVNGEHYSAPHILITTGGKPSLPNIVGADLGETSDDFFNWQAPPKSVAVVGAGYIAVELAGVLHALHVDTHLLVRKHRPLRQFDSTIASKLTELMQTHGPTVHTHAVPEKLERLDNGLLRLSLQGGETLDIEHVIWAIGRQPNTANLNLEAIGLGCTEKGYIEADDWQNTTVPNIYALGDVTGRVELTPVAVAAGRMLAERLFNGQQNAKIDYHTIPTVVFSHPPIGTLGLTQEQAEAQYGADNLYIYQTQFTAMYSAITQHREPTFMKLICHGKDEKIIGLHILGEAADEILQGFAVAIRMGATKADFDRCIAIHPTSAEELVTLTPKNRISL